MNTPGMGFSRQLSHTAFCCWSFFVLFLIPNFKKKLNSNNNRKKKQSTLERKSPCVAQCRPALASRVLRVLVCRLPCPDPSGHYLMATATEGQYPPDIVSRITQSPPPTYLSPPPFPLSCCMSKKSIPGLLWHCPSQR